MAYTDSKTLTFEEFLAQYGDNPRYELIDGELRDMEPTGPHETVEVISTNWLDVEGRKVEEYALLGIPEYWIVDYRGLGGIAFIGKPKQPTFTVYQLIGSEYQQEQYRLSQPIRSPLLLNLQLRLDDILPR